MKRQREEEPDAAVDGQAATETEPQKESQGKKGKYRRPKPWDTDDIDHWKIDPFTADDNKGGVFAEESSFATLFPKYREAYLREVWPLVTRSLEAVGIACVLDLVEGSMTVKTTRRTWDPYAVFKARDLIKLLSRSVPLQQAQRILEDGIACDIIKIGQIVRNKERFVKRRQRLIGPNGNTLKALELLTQCYLLVQGNTVSAVGPYRGLKEIRRVVIDCMRNIHPVYHVKSLMIKRELAKDPKLKNESWDRFLPHFRKTSVKAKPKPTKKATKKEYTPFPPQQTPRKVDMLLESGEYFLKPKDKESRELARKKDMQASKTASRKDEREQEFVKPLEAETPASVARTDSAPSLEALREKFKRRQTAKAR